MTPATPAPLVCPYCGRERALLKKIGIFRYDGMDCCVMCDTPIIDGHAPGCELAAALSGGAR